MTPHRPDAPPMPWSADDPRLTAYALGELGVDDRVDADAALDADSLLAGEVTSIRALAAQLGDALATETSPRLDGLSDRQRFAIRNAARHRQRIGLSLANTPRLWPVLASMAAVVAAFLLFSPGVGRTAVATLAWTDKVRSGNDIEHLQDRTVIDMSRFGDRPTLWTMITGRDQSGSRVAAGAGSTADGGMAPAEMDEGVPIAALAARATAVSLGLASAPALVGNAPPMARSDSQLGSQVHIPLLNFADPSPAAIAAAGDPSRKIIKDATLTLEIDDTTAALGRIDTIAVQSGGYIVQTQTDQGIDSGRTGATVKFAVLVDNFEAALGRLRALGTVALEQASGVDVSQEYTDVQSRIANLEATQARVREFLAQAKTVEEALQVNARLTEIEGQLAELKGRMTYLAGRAAYSTITVTLIGPALPTRTPTITPTATLTPTPTPGTPWSPAPIARDAFGTLRALLQALAAVAIWLAVVGVPIAVLVGAGWWAVRWVRRGMR
ncbi:MAG: DUF4349 domain-containing protein [Ardenticatenales bacterium]